MNPQESLEFVVRFAGANLPELRPGDFLNLRDDLTSFFARPGEDMRGPVGEIVTPSKRPRPAEYELEDFQALQKDVRAILNELISGRDEAMPAAPTRRLEQLEFTSFSSPRMKNRSVLWARGSTRDTFLFRLFLLLAKEPITRVLRCKAEDCNRLFIRKRKQEFCSTRCTNRHYMKDYRKPKTE